jgi:hypothetical protein
MASDDMPTSDETTLEWGQRITEELMMYPLARPDMGAQEMINICAGILENYDQEDLVIVCSYIMRYAAERAWDLRAAVGHE